MCGYCSVGAGLFPLCFCGPSVFGPTGPSGDFATPSWTVLGRRLGTGVDVQVFVGLPEAVFKTFLLPCNPRACPDGVLHTR